MAILFFLKYGGGLTHNMAKLESNIYIATVFVDSLEAEIDVNFTEVRDYYRTDEDTIGGWDSERDSIKINWAENRETGKPVKLSRALRDEIEFILDDSDVLWVEAHSADAPEWVPEHGRIALA